MRRIVLIILMAMLVGCGRDGALVMPDQAQQDNVAAKKAASQ